MQQNLSSFRFRNFLLIILMLLLGAAFYLQWNFPQKLKGIKAEKFQSHPARDLRLEIRDFKQLDPKIYINEQVGKCQDIQIDKNDIGYCVNDKNQIISINTKTDKIQKLGYLGKGKPFGIRLSKDEKLLYIIHSQLGLVQFNLSQRKHKVLVNQYKGQFLISLDAIQIHPTNPDILYLTQATTIISLLQYHIDLMLNNPFGRLFQYNKSTNQLKLITDGLYFANGIVFQQFQGQQTVLIAETNRYRLTRVYLTGSKKGHKQIAIDKLDVFVDNIKANQNGQLWVAGPTARDAFFEYADHHPWVKMILSRLPMKLVDLAKNRKFFGGLKIKFSQNKKNFEINYYIWQSFSEFAISTTLNERNDKLYISSLDSIGVLVVQSVNEKLLKNKPMHKSIEKKEQEF